MVDISGNTVDLGHFGDFYFHQWNDYLLCSEGEKEMKHLNTIFILLFSVGVLLTSILKGSGLEMGFAMLAFVLSGLGGLYILGRILIFALDWKSASDRNKKFVFAGTVYVPQTYPPQPGGKIVTPPPDNEFNTYSDGNTTIFVRQK